MSQLYSKYGIFVPTPTKFQDQFLLYHHLAENPHFLRRDGLYNPGLGVVPFTNDRQILIFAESFFKYLDTNKNYIEIGKRGNPLFKALEFDNYTALMVELSNMFPHMVLIDNVTELTVFNELIYPFLYFPPVSGRSESIFLMMDDMDAITLKLTLP